MTFALCTGRLRHRAFHAEQANCNERELGLWMHLYSLAALQIAGWTINKARRMRAAGDNRFEAQARLTRGDHVWQDHVTAQCQLDMGHWTTGNAPMTDKPICRMRMVAERLFELRGLQDCQPGGPSDGCRTGMVRIFAHGMRPCKPAGCRQGP